MMVLFLISNIKAECFPDYSCEEWGECDEGLRSRICKDMKCGKRDLVERKFCIEDCEPRINCKEWGSCIYTDKIEDLIQGEIKFGGYRERLCEDVNGCVESFWEEGLCEESYKLDIKKIKKCGSEFLVVSDLASEKQVAKINLEQLKKRKLDLTFVLAESQYCPPCYNGKLDENEEKIDCGIDCKPCKEQHFFPWYKLFSMILWIISIFFIFLCILNIFIYIKQRRK